MEGRWRASVRACGKRKGEKEGERERGREKEREIGKEGREGREGSARPRVAMHTCCACLRVCSLFDEISFPTHGGVEAVHI